ncbi:MAG TPA: DUF1343 domain-containing protein [Rariglobus sp.]|jgi:uncharacterized protein YbbC (DUF1343 family)|nr:DUF1343 domain-containing protein [Rariglobus sp.]
MLLGYVRPLSLLFLIAGFFGTSGCHSHTSRPMPPPAVKPPAAVTSHGPRPIVTSTFPVMLGIDVLEANGFNAVAGKRIGLLTHVAGVNRRGESTIDVLRRAPNTKLVCLFSPEHGLYGNVKASINYDDAIDPHTGLPVYSLYGKNRKPTAAQLKGLDAVVIDLQDIGVRSYTFNVVMRYTMEACFSAGVEVIVLDRPNPLGGYKVDGPLLDREWMSGVGAFRVPYVHGLTMGELARMAAHAPGVLDIPDNIRKKGRLTIIPMRGWTRSMRWPETGLKFVPTSPLIRDFNAVVGYAMVGLGCEFSGFKHGIGVSYPFRGLSFKGVTPDKLIQDLNTLHVAGLSYRKVTAPDTAGKPHEGVYVDVTNWATWNPTELSFALMRLACRYDPPNPFAKLDAKDARSFNIHVGSTAWWDALRRDGARVNLESFLADWHTKDRIYQQQTRPYWIYN